MTEKTVPFAEAYRNAYHQRLTSAAFSAYDAVYVLEAAVERAGTADSDALVSALEETSYAGTTGTIEFASLDGELPHDVEYGPDDLQPLYFQWQEDGDGVQKRVLWPDELREAEYRPPPWA